jgi:hypothetical protein
MRDADGVNVALLRHRGKNGELWTGGMNTDRAGRVNPKPARSLNISCPKIRTSAACSG